MCHHLNRFNALGKKRKNKGNTKILLVPNQNLREGLWYLRGFAITRVVNKDNIARRYLYINRGTNEFYELNKYILENRCNSIKICFESLDI